MEVDTKAEAELLLSEDGTEENVDFSHGDVELLLGDDDVNAFANESFETSDTATSEDKPSETTDSEAENKSKSTPTTHTTTGHEYHHPRGRGDRGRGRYFRGGPPPGFFPRGGLRPPFPGKFRSIFKIGDRRFGENFVKPNLKKLNIGVNPIIFF